MVSQYHLVSPSVLGLARRYGPSCAGDQFETLEDFRDCVDEYGDLDGTTAFSSIPTTWCVACDGARALDVSPSPPVHSPPAHARLSIRAVFISGAPRPRAGTSSWPR
jgi:hypothetical protein